MKGSLSILKVLKLDFSSFSAQELLDMNVKKDLPVWARDVLEFLEEFVSQEEITCFTSGTTGQPKEVSLKNHQLVGSARNTLSFFDLAAGSKVLLPLSCKHIAGKMMVVRAVVGKLVLTVVEPSADVSSVISESFDFSVLVPLQVKSLFSHNQGASVHNFGKILIGGSDISQKLIENLKLLKIAAWCSFGMTETMSHFAMRQLSPIEEERYHCLKGFGIESNDKGLLTVSNTNLDLKEIVTNDVVNIAKDDTFIWLGRADNVVNSGGVKLHPEVIEQKIKHLLSTLQNFIVFGIPDDKFGEKLVLFYEGSMVLSKAEKSNIKLGLDKYECPQEYLKIKQLNRTKLGKIIRKNYHLK